MPEYYGGGRRQPKVLIEGKLNGKLDDGTLESKKGFQKSKRNMLGMQNSKKNGDSPQGRRLAQQQSKQSPRSVPKLPQQTPSSDQDMQGSELWSEDAAVRVLREAQPAIREIREPDDVQGKSIYPGCRVRRLTCTECERLQGYPDGWTKEGVDGPVSDSQRYKCLGNSVTTNVITAIMLKIKEVM